MRDYFDNADGFGEKVLLFIILLAVVFGSSCLMAWIAMLLWNWVMPIIWVGAPVMTFWPMWGLVELCSILFKAKIDLNN